MDIELLLTPERQCGLPVPLQLNCNGARSCRTPAVHCLALGPTCSIDSHRNICIIIIRLMVINQRR